MKCIDPKIGKLISLYDFDALSPEKKARFETHLMECDYCFQSLYRLSSVIEEMRENPQAFAPVLSTTRSERLVDRAKTLWHQLINVKVPAPLIRPLAVAVPVMVALVVALFIVFHPTNEYVGLARIEPIPYIPLNMRNSLQLTKAEKLIRQGMEFYGSGDYSRAIAELSRAVDMAPKNANAHFYLALSYLLLKKPDPAIEHLQKVLELNTDFLLEKCYWYLGNAYLLKNKPKKALKFLKKVIKMKGVFIRNSELLVRAREERMAK